MGRQVRGWCGLRTVRGAMVATPPPTYHLVRKELELLLHLLALADGGRVVAFEGGEIAVQVREL